MSSTLKLQVVLQALDKATAPIRELTQSSSGLGKQLKETRNQLKQLENQQGTIDSFRKLKEASGQSGAALAAQKQKVKELAQQMQGVGPPTKALKNEFDAATKEAKRLKQAHADNQQQLQGLRKSLTDAGFTVRRLEKTGKGLADGEAKLSKQIDETRQAIERQKTALAGLDEQRQRSQKLSALGSNMKQAGQVTAMHGAGAVAAGGAGLRGMWQLAGEGMEFDSTMSKVQSLARLDKNSDELQALRDQAKKLGAETMFSATDAARGQAFLAMAGFTPDSIQAAMPGLLDMALAGDIDLGRTADIASNILGGFKLDPSEMGRVSDTLTKAFTTSNTSLESLGETMKYVGPVASAAGMELEEAAAMAGLLGNVGIQGSQAGTTLRTMVLNLAGPAKKGKKAMEALGVATADAHGNMREVPDILVDIAKMTEKMGTAERMAYLTDIFGKEPAAGVAELISQAGSKGIEEYVKNVRDNAGTSHATARTMADNLIGDLDELDSAWSGLKIDIFEEQNSGLRSLVQGLTEVLGKVTIWSKENAGLVSGIVKWGAIILGVVSALGALALTVGTGMMALGGLIKLYAALSGSMGVAIKAVGLLGKAFMVAGKLSLASPLGIAVAALVVGAIVLRKYWGHVAAFFGGFFRGLLGGFKDMGRAIRDGFSPVVLVFGVLKATFAPVIDLFRKLFGPANKAADGLQRVSSAGESMGRWAGAAAALLGVAAAIKYIGTAVFTVGKLMMANPMLAAIGLLALAGYMLYQNWDDIVASLKQMWAALGAFFGGWVDDIVGGARQMASDISDWWADKAAILAADWAFVTGSISELWDSLWGGITGTLSGIWSTITEAFSGGIGGVSALLLNWSPLGIFYQIMQPLFDWLGLDLPAKFSEFGANLISGLVDGIKGMASKAKEAVVGVGENVTGWFKDTLGIHSPSRVFMELGGDTMDGLALGLQAEQDGPLKQVAALGKQLTAAGALAFAGSAVAGSLPPPALPELPALQPAQNNPLASVSTVGEAALGALTAKLEAVGTALFANQQPQRPLFDNRPPIGNGLQPAMAGPVAGDTITINVHAAPGMDTAELARLVQQELQKAQLKKQMHGRSRMGDLD